jgi:type IX secretion system PorP/SprF family membrane protein
LLNPAISGIENYVDFKLGHRQQWTGIDKAPRTTFLSANWNLTSEYLWKNPLSLPDKDDDPMSKSYMQNYTASPPHHGMGVIATLDRVGPVTRLDASLTYAYHLQVADKYNLSVGVGAGISRISLDVNALTVKDYDDYILGNLIKNQIKPDLSLGTWFYGARFFVGLAAQQILPQKLTVSGSGNTKETDMPHFFLTSGYKLFIDDEISVVPSLMMKKMNAAPISLDVNAKVSFKDRFWLGGSYRSDDSYSALAGINISKLVNLTYSYDLTTSALSKVSSGSHEIVLGLQFNKAYEVLSTMRMW